jgi:DNA-binding SARP family transcriptional activator
MDDGNHDEGSSSFPSFRVWLCGTFRMERRVGSGYELVRPAEWGGSSYPRLLLKALLCCPGRQARREAMLDLLWPNTEPEQAVQNLNTAVTRLRKVLTLKKGEASLLLTDEDSHVYRLAGQSGLWVDVDAALTLLGEAERRGRTSPDALALLEEAESYLSKGMILQDEEGQWAAGRRATVEQARYRSRLWLAEAYAQQQMPGQAETILTLLLEEDPTDEDVLVRLMLLLHRQGMTHQALRIYERACEIAAREEVELSEATRKLAAQLAKSDRQIYPPESLTSPSSPMIGQNSASPLLSRAITSALLEAMRELAGQERNAFEQSFPQQIDPVSAGEFSHLPFLELQRMLSQGVVSINTSTLHDDTGYLLSRRQVLLTIASLAMPLLVASQHQSSNPDVEELLSSVAISIDACWQLSNEYEITAVYSAISTYLTPLIALTRQHLSYRKAAAHLAAQAFLLKAITGRHVVGLQAAEVFGKEAVRYSEIAEDPILHVATIRHLAMIYFYAKRHKEELALYHQMKPLLSSEKIPPLVHSFVYAGWAGTQAINGLQQEAQASLALARETLSRQPTTEICPLYIDYDPSQLFISEGLAHYDLGSYKEALDSFLHVDGLSPKIPVAERGRLEFLNCQALTVLHLPHQDRDMQQCIDYWTAAIQGAMTLKSKQRYDEASRIYEFMEFTWPHEKKIKALREIMEPWNKKEVEDPLSSTLQ